MIRIISECKGTIQRILYRVNYSNQESNTAYIKVCCKIKLFIVKPVLLVIKDKDHNHSIVDIMVCENEYTAQRVQNTLKNHPKYSLPCYYSEIQFPEVIMESSLSCPTCNHVNGHHSTCPENIINSDGYTYRQTQII